MKLLACEQSSEVIFMQYRGRKEWLKLYSGALFCLWRIRGGGGGGGGNLPVFKVDMCVG